eukprot:9043886-Pyramimonas_sp.AAC.1
MRGPRPRAGRWSGDRGREPRGPHRERRLYAGGLGMPGASEAGRAAKGPTFCGVLLLRRRA